MKRFIILLLATWSYISPAISTITASPASPSSPTFIPKKIVVIGDVHSDIYRFKQILQEANIVDATDNWIAPPNTTVVQLGDQIDPKLPDKDDINDNHHFKMIYYTDKLQKLAQENNGKFISMIGNHELMNIEKIKNKPRLRDIIAARSVILSDIPNYLFCHGGFRKRHYYLLHIYNKTMKDVNAIWYKYLYDIPLTLTEELILDNLILDVDNSILYSRIADNKEDINLLFNLLNVDYMFVGHTVADAIHMKDKIWYLDLYLRDAFENNMYNYIIIEDGDIKINHLHNTCTDDKIMSFLSLLV